MKTVYDLMVSVAEHFAGEPVFIRFVNHINSYGMTRRDKETGLLTIDLRTHYDTEEQELRVFLHEVSHCKNHVFIPSNIQLPAEEPAPESIGKQLREAQAETEAEAWLRYAEKHRDRENYEYFTGCLLTLLDY